MNDDLPIALHVLERFAAPNPPLLVYPIDLAKEIGADKGRVYKAMRAMEQAEWVVESVGASQLAYRPGPKVLRLRRNTLSAMQHEAELAMAAVAGIGDLLRRYGEQADQRLGIAERSQAEVEAQRAVPAKWRGAAPFDQCNAPQTERRRSFYQVKHPPKRRGAAPFERSPERRRRPTTAAPLPS